MAPLRRSTAVLATGVAVSLALLLKSGLDAGMWLQFTLGKIAYSTSDGAALFLLGFVVLSVWRLRSVSAGCRPALLVFLLALSLGHGLNLWLTLRYMAEMQIPLGSHAYHWLNDSYSFSGLFHSHLGKTAFAVFWRLIGWAPSAYDGGSVFLAWVPAWAAWGIALAFVVSLAASLLALPALSRDRSSVHVALYVIVSALSVRGMIDGGPLAPGMPPVFLALAWMVYRPEAPGRKILSFWIAGSILLLGYVFLWVGLSSGLPALGSFLFPLCLLLWMGMTGKPASSLLLRVLLVGLLTAMFALDASDNLLPLVSTLPSGCRAISTVISTASTSERISDCSGLTGAQVYERLGESARKPRSLLLSPAQGAGEHALSVRLLMVDSNREQLSLNPSDAWPNVVIERYSMRGGWLRLSAKANPEWPPVLASVQADVITRNNYNVYLWELARSLTRGGLSEFILLPETRNNSEGLWE
jgi:hypothetical protein